MKGFVVVFLFLAVCLVCGDQVIESEDTNLEVPPELEKLIEDGQLTLEDLLGPDVITDILEQFAKEGDLQTWKKCFTVNKSWKIIFKKIRFKISGCIEVEWLNKDYGVRIKLNIGKLKMTKEFSLRNPPSLCYGIPGFKLAKVCVTFSKISLHKKSACVRFGFKFLKWGWGKDIGCFKLYHVMVDATESSPDQIEAGIENENDMAFDIADDTNNTD